MAHTKRQLAELAAQLTELPAENDGMLLSEFDGFVAGLLVCPELILPGEWLPVVWGAENAPTFEDIGQAQATIDAVTAHYNRVSRALAAPDAEYEAIFDSDPANGEIVWGPWICGFERAMCLRPDCWEATLDCDDEEVQAAIPMILALYAIDTGATELDDAALDELDAIAPELIPETVLTLNNWSRGRWKRSAASNLDRPPMGPTHVGRNDRCPCGSE